MNLNKLFEIQKELDTKIVNEHSLQDQDLLPKKILALQVELGELANEWRGFKFWSKDQEPRNFWTPRLPEADSPLLEEYVDCLHFILSIGLELGYTSVLVNKQIKLHLSLSVGYEEVNNITISKQFSDVFYSISELEDTQGLDEYVTTFAEFISLGEMLGFSTEQIEQAYLDKNKVNHERQANGY
ncbi:dUTP diphosphatase [Virgibacillus salexigens]|uniref:dUTPase n=1 Tax=Virgibacillus massiliensis TaxID=1462526 RepID=A0A024QBA9_9BACI|nr:dUTP diphosphatase [Virgibacillus massiliensis]CDQ39527.1 dUTPase [Virgibacillus massiliensis]